MPWETTAKALLRTKADDGLYSPIIHTSCHFITEDNQADETSYLMYPEMAPKTLYPT